MGLDDIDEVDPFSKTKQLVSAPTLAKGGGTITGGSDGSAVIDLEDLFGGPVVSNSLLAVAPQGDGAQLMGSAGVCHLNSATSSLPDGDKKNLQQNMTGQIGDFFDTYFTQPSSTEASVLWKTKEEKVYDLLDLSKPVEQVKYPDALSLLEAFENQGKGRTADKRNEFLLADLSKGVSSNLVKARLLNLMNYYDLLGVSRDATLKEIRQHYKMRTLELHPDRAGCDQTPEEAELFKRITTAHDVLTDLEKRRKYDEELRHSEEGIVNDEYWKNHSVQE